MKTFDKGTVEYEAIKAIHKAQFDKAKAEAIIKDNRVLVESGINESERLFAGKISIGVQVKLVADLTTLSEADSKRLAELEAERKVIIARAQKKIQIAITK